MNPSEVYDARIKKITSMAMEGKLSETQFLGFKFIADIEKMLCEYDEILQDEREERRGQNGDREFKSGQGNYAIKLNRQIYRAYLLAGVVTRGDSYCENVLKGVRKVIEKRGITF